jgi:hypothetical protein
MGDPEVIVYEIKGQTTLEEELGKGNQTMLIELTGMTQGIISTSRIGDDTRNHLYCKDVEAKVAEMVMPGRGGSDDN